MVREAEERGASKETLRLLLGQGRSKKGMFEGNLDDGELEIGQASALLSDILPASKIVDDIWAAFLNSCNQLGTISADNKP